MSLSTGLPSSQRPRGAWRKLGRILYVVLLALVELVLLKKDDLSLAYQGLAELGDASWDGLVSGAGRGKHRWE